MASLKHDVRASSRIVVLGWELVIRKIHIFFFRSSLRQIIEALVVNESMPKKTPVILSLLNKNYISAMLQNLKIRNLNYSFVEYMA